MLLQPLKIFVDFRGVNDEQKFRLLNLVNNQVIDDAAVTIEQESVLPLADVQLRHIIRQHGIEPITRTFCRDDKLSHVRNIKHAHRFSNRLMFVHDAGVLHRHEPAAERHHSRFEPHVFLIKRRLFFGGIAHLRSLAQVEVIAPTGPHLENEPATVTMTSHELA